MAVETFDVGGTDTWTAPAGVTSVFVQVWAAGGGGGLGALFNPSDGGGGGAYSEKVVTVTPSTVYNLRVGETGSKNSWFDTNTNVFAEGGGLAVLLVNGLGGQASNGFGDTTLSGGDGGNINGSIGGGGGSGSGTVLDGVDAVLNVGATAPTGGGDGGDGSSGSPQNGDQPGGGGGGGGALFFVGGAGGVGKVVLTYTAVITTPTINSFISGTNGIV